MLTNSKHIKILAAGILLMVGSLNAQEVKTTPFGKGINFAALDSSMTMQMHVRMQALLDMGYESAQDELSTKFLVRRYRLKFGGYAYDPKLRYKMELGISNRDQGNAATAQYGSAGSNIILDAVIKYQFSKRWDFWVGQTKLPGNRERVVSSANLQFVDRSNVNSKFNIDRDMGFQLRGKYKLGTLVLKPILSWSMGEGRGITASNFGGFDYTGRLEILPMGDFTGKGDYFLADLKREAMPKLAIGIGYDYNVGAARQGGQLGKFVYDSTGKVAENDLSSFIADIHFKYNGFSFLSEFINKKAGNKIDGLSSNYTTGTGFVAQAGYLLKSNVEFALRYTTVTPDDEDYSSVDEVTEYTLGVSKYIVGHNLKVQSDLSYFQAPLDDLDGNWRFRLQVELQL